MSTVKRKAPTGVWQWYEQCLQDLDAGRHAVGCGCERWEGMLNDHETTPNACSEIVRCALEMRDYECEVGDAEAGRP